MCSLTLTDFIDAQLSDFGEAMRDKIERKMKQRAFAASPETQGILDAPQTHFRSGFAEDLRKAGVRHARIGRHRVYYTGKHTECNYVAFYLKVHKQGDNSREDDNNPGFHEILRGALATVESKRIAEPGETAAAIEVPDYQNQEWFKKWGRFSTRDEE